MDADATPDALRLHRIHRSFNSTRALNGITLQVPRGAIYGLLGPNGAGKTTTIRIALGLIRPDGGAARTLGMDPTIQSMEIRRRTGVVLEHDGHYEPMSARENLEYFGRLHGLPQSLRVRRSAWLLDLLELTDKTNAPVGKLSKGMKRMLALARALLHGPELLILDEPTVGLDARMVTEMRRFLLQIVRERGVTVIIATHNLHEAENLCDRVGVLHEGDLILEGPPHRLGIQHEANSAILHGDRFTDRVVRALKATPGVKDATMDPGTPTRITLRLEPDASAAPAVRNAIEGGAQVEAVERPRVTLEEAFLSATSKPVRPGSGVKA